MLFGSKKIVENSPFGEYADKSTYKMAECYRRLRRYDQAIEAYEKVIKDYPESDLVSEAKYQLAYTRYEASLDPEYDQETTEEALREFKKISKTTAVPAVAEEAEAALRELRSKKAGNAIKIAEFYERQKKYQSAIIYYKDIVSKYPDTKEGEKAREKIEYLKTKMGN